MPIIAYLGKDITEYKKDVTKFLNNLQFYCPVHGYELTGHGNYTRKIKDYGMSIRIYRLGCPDKTCNYTQAILPDFIQPYKHYSAHEISSVLVDAESGDEPLGIDSEASISTIRRWISQYIDILDEKISKLKIKIFQMCKKIVNETTLSEGQPMDTIHKLLSLLPVIHCTNTLGAAFIYTHSVDAPT